MCQPGEAHRDPGECGHTEFGYAELTEEEIRAVCNLYSATMPQEAMRRLFKGLTDNAGNLEPGRVYPDQGAPIIRNGEGGPELVKARWGMPSPRSVLKTERDPGVTNIRNLASPHWRRWLG